MIPAIDMNLISAPMNIKRHKDDFKWVYSPYLPLPKFTSKDIGCYVELNKEGKKRKALKHLKGKIGKIQEFVGGSMMVVIEDEEFSFDEMQLFDKIDYLEYI